MFGLRGKYASTDEHPLNNMGQVFVRRTNTLSTRGKYSSMDEYPLKNMGLVFVHVRIPSQKHGASIRPQVFVHGRIPSTKHGQVFVWTSTLSKTWGKQYSVDESYRFWNKRGANTHYVCFEYSTNFNCKLERCSNARPVYWREYNVTMPCRLPWILPGIIFGMKVKVHCTVLYLKN